MFKPFCKIPNEKYRMAELMKEQGYDYAFDPSACQNCPETVVSGESGYIWVSQEEICAIADKLSLSKEAFINQYLQKIRYRFTIKEIAYDGGFGCVFFDREKRCTIYDVRPHNAEHSRFGSILKTI